MRQDWQDEESRKKNHGHPIHPVKERLFRVSVLSFVEGFRVFRGLSSYI